MAELDDFAAYSRLADSLIAQYLTRRVGRVLTVV
jgi:hypothetical protein